MLQRSVYQREIIKAITNADSRIPHRDPIKKDNRHGISEQSRFPAFDLTKLIQSGKDEETLCKTVDYRQSLVYCLLIHVVSSLLTNSYHYKIVINFEISRSEDFPFSDSLDSLSEMRLNPHEVRLNQTLENFKNSPFVGSISSHMKLSFWCDNYVNSQNVQPKTDFKPIQKLYEPLIMKTPKTTASLWVCAQRYYWQELLI